MVAVSGAFFAVFPDGGGDEMGFPLLIGGLVVQNLFAAAVLCPKGFALALAVAADHGIGGIQNGAGAAVVLLQPDDGGIAELLLEGEDIFDGGTAEFINALVVIAHDAQITVAAGQKADQKILGVVGVLIFIHHDVAVAALVFLQHLRVFTEQPDGKQDDIIEIQGVGGLEHLLIAAVDLGGDLQGEVIPGRICHPLGGQHFILGSADIGKQRLGRKVFIADVKLRHGILDDPDGIIGIVDGEVTAVTQHLYFRPQDAGAGRMEGGGMDVLPAAAEHPGQSCAQLPCGFIGEGDGQNIPRGGDIVGDEPRGPFHIAAVGGAELQGVPVLLGQGGHIILPGGGQAELQKIGDAVDEDGGFSAAGQLPFASAIPLLRVRATPIFLGLLYRVILGSRPEKHLALSAVPSVEQSSKIRSSQFVYVCAITDCTASDMYSSALYAGIITETSGCFCSTPDCSFTFI